MVNPDGIKPTSGDLIPIRNSTFNRDITEDRGASHPNILPLASPNHRYITFLRGIAARETKLRVQRFNAQAQGAPLYTSGTDTRQPLPPSILHRSNHMHDTQRMEIVETAGGFHKLLRTMSQTVCLWRWW